MTHRTIARLVATVLAAVAFVACSDQSPVASSASPDHLESAVPLSRPELGQYDLEFSWNGTTHLVTIIAHVRDAGGGAPGGGTVTLQYCSYNGYPTDDITQPDEAPSSACAEHTAHWVTLVRGSLPASGDAVLWELGPVNVVTVIGFRLLYTGGGSGVQNYTLVEDWYRPL
jgi:hypothetical protein